MKKKYIWIVCLISIALLFTLQSSVSATTLDELFSQGDSFINKGNGSNAVDVDMDAVNDMSSLIYRLLYTLFLPLAIIVGIVMGIKYMMASVEAKAALKQSLITYFVSVTILFGGYGIWKLLMQLFG